MKKHSNNSQINTPAAAAAATLEASTAPVPSSLSSSSSLRSVDSVPPPSDLSLLYCHEVLPIELSRGSADSEADTDTEENETNTENDTDSQYQSLLHHSFILATNSASDTAWMLSARDWMNAMTVQQQCLQQENDTLKDQLTSLQQQLQSNGHSNTSNTTSITSNSPAQSLSNSASAVPSVPLSTYLNHIDHMIEQRYQLTLLTEQQRIHYHTLFSNIITDREQQLEHSNQRIQQQQQFIEQLTQRLTRQEKHKLPTPKPQRQRE